MRIGSSLVLIVIGAILKFAGTRRSPCWHGTSAMETAMRDWAEDRVDDPAGHVRLMLPCLGTQ